MIPTKPMILEFITENWKWLQWVLTSTAIAIAWFKDTIFKQKDQDVSIEAKEAQIQSINIQNLAKTMDVYKAILDDIVPRYEQHLQDYKIQLKFYREQLEKYRVELKERDREIVILHKELNELKAEFKTLTLKFKHYETTSRK